MKLYDNEWAPSPRRVRIFLAEKGIEVERVPIDLRQNEHFQDAYLAINPRGMVPALELDDGRVICESAAICRYFEALTPEPSLFGQTPLDIATVESWTRRIENDGYAAAVYVFRNATPRMDGRGASGKWPPIPVIPELAHRGAIMWSAFVQALDHRLAEHEWIATDRYSFADITALITIDFAERAKLLVPDSHKGIARWRAAANARPSAGA
ncbi:MAG: glutathione S-transferase family protein [Sphingomonas sp.]